MTEVGPRGDEPLEPPNRNPPAENAPREERQASPGGPPPAEDLSDAGMPGVPLTDERRDELATRLYQRQLFEMIFLRHLSKRISSRLLVANSIFSVALALTTSGGALAASPGFTVVGAVLISVSPVLPLANAIRRFDVLQKELFDARADADNTLWKIGLGSLETEAEADAEVRRISGRLDDIESRNETAIHMAKWFLLIGEKVVKLATEDAKLELGKRYR